MKTFRYDAVVIRGGRVIDPIRGRDETADIAVVHGVIAKEAPPHANVLAADGWLICQGFMDIHVHLREPGQAHKETIETGTAAAKAGGFTYVAAMPNTVPPVDTVEIISWILERARLANHCTVGPIATITRGRLGAEITDFAALRQAGAVAFSDDGSGVEDDDTMRAAFERAAQTGVVLVQHCDYRAISGDGIMNSGPVARRLGFPGMDPRAEEAMIERDIALARETGGRCHVAHISTARGVDLVRRAKADGVSVTAEVCPHHLLLTEDACLGADPNTKMNPPLRTAGDVEACRHGLLDGTIDCVVTDHAPHAFDEKAVGFMGAPPGIVGLETGIGLVALAMIESGLADWPRLIEWFTTGPAGVLNLRRDPIEVGSAANLTILDPYAEWTVEPQQFASKGRNTPFSGWTLTGRPVGTFRGPEVALPVDYAGRMG